MIKIIKGKYGHYIPNNPKDLSKGGRLVPVTPESDPISLSTEQEKKLVSRGVAEYVKGKPATDTPGTPPAGTTSDPGTPPAGTTDDPLAYNEEMKLDTLKTVAIKGYKCDAEAIGKMRTKKEVIAAIEKAAQEQDGDDEEDGSGTPTGEQPDLAPAVPVQ